MNRQPRPSHPPGSALNQWPTNTHTDCETHLSVCLFELLGTSSVFGEQCVQRCLCHRTTGCLGRVCRRFELRRSRGVLGKFCVQRGLLWVRLCSRGLCFCRRLQQRIKVRSVSLCWSAGVTHSCRAGCCIARGRALPSRLLRDLVVVVNPVRGIIQSRFPPAKGAIRTRRRVATRAGLRRTRLAAALALHPAPEFPPAYLAGCIARTAICPRLAPGRSC